MVLQTYCTPEKLSVVKYSNIQRRNEKQILLLETLYQVAEQELSDEG